MRKLFLLLAASGALFVAGCGDDDSGDSSSSSSQPAATESAPESAAPATGDAVEIHMKDFAFAPGTQTVKVGTKVTWVNDDSADHNVVGGDIKSDNFGQGKTFEYTADKAGTISYVCTLHSGMTGTLTVTQ